MTIEFYEHSKLVKTVRNLTYNQMACICLDNQFSDVPDSYLLVYDDNGECVDCQGQTEFHYSARELENLFI